jgi:hypothetical protein
MSLAEKPADADALSHLNSLGVRTHGRDPTDDLVAENRGVLRDAPVIVQDGDVRVAQTAVINRDFNILGSERSEISGLEHHRLFGRLHGPGLVHPRVSWSDTSAGVECGHRLADFNDTCPYVLESE